MSLQQQVKEALEMANPGPWIKDKEKHGYEYGIMSPSSGWLLGTISKKNDAHLIANAPTWLQLLLDELEKTQRGKEVALSSHKHLEDELEKARKENNDLLEALSDRADSISYLTEKLEKAQKEIERLKAIDERECDITINLKREHAAMKEALEWYADSENCWWRKIDKDGGERARAVLSTLSKEEQPND